MIVGPKVGDQHLIEGTKLIVKADLVYLPQNCSDKVSGQVEQGHNWNEFFVPLNVFLWGPGGTLSDSSAMLPKYLECSQFACLGQILCMTRGGARGQKVVLGRQTVEELPPQLCRRELSRRIVVKMTDPNGADCELGGHEMLSLLWGLPSDQKGWLRNVIARIDQAHLDPVQVLVHLLHHVLPYG